ncbi:MAG: hypothetical protein JST62_09145 [Bacteroidetes bacterium]|nr:hypothetical protein [Bacteroidota bacterium]
METQNLPDYNANYRLKTLTSGDWALNIFLASIPIVGFILLIVWALGDGNIHRRNWARGMFLIYIIIFAISIVLLVFFGLGALILGDNHKY